MAVYLIEQYPLPGKLLRIKIFKSYRAGFFGSRIYYGNAACRIHCAVFISVPRFAFVGGEYPFAVFADSYHIRLHSCHKAFDQLTVIVQDSNASGSRIIRSLKGDHDVVVCRIYRNAGHISVFEA